MNHIVECSIWGRVIASQGSFGERNRQYFKGFFFINTFLYQIYKARVQGEKLSEMEGATITTSTTHSTTAGNTPSKNV